MPVDIPRNLRPYIFHGLDLVDAPDGETKGDCPFCGNDNSFYVNIEKGTAHCWSCTISSETEKGGCNPVTFLRRLWTDSDKRTNGETTEFAKERGLLYPDTLTHWGVVRSTISRDWLIPGYNLEGALCQLYRRLRTHERYELRPTPTLPHQMHGLPLFDKKKNTIYLHESWGNALAFWEIARNCKLEDGALTTATEAHSLLKNANVLAVANCGAVGEPFAKFLSLFAGKRVVLMFDNDHPKNNSPDGAGLAATKRAVKLLLNAEKPPKSIEFLSWGADGWHPDLADGYDVRDHLTGDTLEERIKALDTLLKFCVPIPEQWKVAAEKPSPPKGASEIEPKPCSSWLALKSAMRNAWEWRTQLDEVLSVMCAVALSTPAPGDQLFLQLIGDAGSAKTKLAEAMLTSKHCYPLEHLTGFHSGWKDSSGDDYSLLSRINGKCLITPEGDVMMSSPQFTQIMSQQRRIFDGTSGASFKNRKEDLRWTNLRTPWIICGTPALMDTDQSRLGDRFLRIVIDAPTDLEKSIILKKVRHTAFAMLQQQHTNGEAGSSMSGDMLEAYRLTGGYVDWLWVNGPSKLNEVIAATDQEYVGHYCERFAEFTADMRARPNRDEKKEETTDTKELPTRLTHQFIRLACCVAVVLNRPRVDDDCLARVRKVAIDTGRGRTLDLIRQLARIGPDGSTKNELAIATCQDANKEEKLLKFLARPLIRVVERFSKERSNQHWWRLSPRFLDLYKEVVQPK